MDDLSIPSRVETVVPTQNTLRRDATSGDPRHRSKAKPFSTPEEEEDVTRPNDDDLHEVDEHA